MQANLRTPIANVCHTQGRPSRFFPFHFSHQDAAKALAIYRPGVAANDLAADAPTPIDQQLADAFRRVSSYLSPRSCSQRLSIDAFQMRIAAGVSTRRYASTQEPVPAAHRPSAASKSAVSRRFVQLSQEQLAQWLARPLGELDLAVVMIDGIHFRDRVILLALGIDAQGNKHVLGLREGSTEAARVVTSLLSDLIDRGLDAQRMRLWVIDGGKALRKAIVQTFGAHALIQRCQEHKRRNVLEHLPEDMQASVKRALKDAWSATDADVGRRQLQRLASSLQAKHPGAAASLREGLEETLTVQELGITGALYRTLRTTNPIENLNGSVARFSRNVKRWGDGQMVLRWVASALVTGSRIQRDGHIGNTGIAVALPQQLDQCTAPPARGSASPEAIRIGRSRRMPTSKAGSASRGAGANSDGITSSGTSHPHQGSATT